MDVGVNVGVVVAEQPWTALARFAKFKVECVSSTARTEGSIVVINVRNELPLKPSCKTRVSFESKRHTRFFRSIVCDGHQGVDQIRHST